ncbi:MAG TPA: hypothetical protein VHY79_15870 [Rhizomicrobium sp.]|nr:hypothetical protein [Rhizomicrobium sp.]
MREWRTDDCYRIKGTMTGSQNFLGELRATQVTPFAVPISDATDRKVERGNGDKILDQALTASEITKLHTEISITTTSALEEKRPRHEVLAKYPSSSRPSP